MRYMPFIITAAIFSASPAVSQSEYTPDVVTPGSWQEGHWRDEDLGRAIFEGYADRSFIWLRGESNKVVKFNRADGSRTVVAENAVDLLHDGAHLWVVTDTPGHEPHIRDLRSEQAQPIRLVTHERSYQSLFATGQKRPGVLTSLAAYTPNEDGWKRRELPASVITQTVAPDGQTHLYFGLNRGEFGGGLRRIDLETGTISIVYRPNEGSGERLPSPSDRPVVGLFTSPDQPGCVHVGIGLAHLTTSIGHVYQVCGDNISTVFDTPKPLLRDRWMMVPVPWPLDNLIPLNDGWIATSRGRYFRSRNGLIEEHEYAPFRNWSGLRLSDEQQGVLFVVSSCCWGGGDHLTLYRAMPIPVMD
ncbi:hypothetical protein [uncultured Brevundimonas sp.]|uniref:hypothetical protein n=1 Tax=uncultured Brevundimonas sp. TaxID=213418 RepID=UPI002608D5B2|nr:hypothetical protein [uncultured Brevundimonas sp.]